MTLPIITAEQIAASLSPADAVAALEASLRRGLDPAADIPRVSTPVKAGELLYMPSEARLHAGVKILSIGADNQRRGRERVQGIYLLMDAETLTPKALLDGVGLTNLRTAAVSALAATHLASPRASRLVVFGSGPQAKAHIEAIRAVRPIADVVIIGRSGYKAEGLAAWAIERGLRARIGQAVPTKQALHEADIVVCATTAAEPLFEAEWVQPGATVIAIGSHEPAKRELPAQLFADAAAVVVEDAGAAMREAGDVIMAVDEGAIRPDDLIGLRQLALGEVAVEGEGPRVFKSVGQSWEDLALAAAIARRAPREPVRYPVGGVGRSRRI